MKNCRLPSLKESGNEVDTAQFYFSESANWIVPRMVMVGESPYRSSSVEKTIQSLCKDGGVTTFLCLQAEVPPQSHDCVDFGGTKEMTEAVKSYAEVAHQIEDIDSSNLKFVYYGIPDFEPARSLQELGILIEDLVRRVKEGEILYIHCKGGVGRSGVVGACILSNLYPSMNVDGVLERIEISCRGRWRNSQSGCENITSPETASQCQQVRDYVSSIRNKNEKCINVTTQDKI